MAEQDGGKEDRLEHLTVVLWKINGESACEAWTNVQNTHRFFHLNGIIDLLPKINKPATLPTTQATTKEYIIPLTQIFRSCVSVGRSRMSRMG